MASLSLSSSVGHRRRAKPPGHMGPPFVVGLSARRDESSSPPDSARDTLSLSLLSPGLWCRGVTPFSLALSISLSLCICYSHICA